MLSFSQRMGLKETRSKIQIDSIDLELRNQLWNMFLILWEGLENERGTNRLENLYRAIWHDFFKAPIDSIPNRLDDVLDEIRQKYFAYTWDKVYDFIEFICLRCSWNFTLKQHFNHVLEQNLSGYRIGPTGTILQLTSEQELQEVAKAINCQTTSKAVEIHLKTAIDKLADRKSPDSRNSIKESISAVESICKIIADDSKADLGKALKKLKDKNISIHTTLELAFLKLYAYTSDAGGIRHALSDESQPNNEDAIFMLVACSAFINYLKAKSIKAGVKL
jgi:hypothetical protein